MTERLTETMTDRSLCRGVTIHLATKSQTEFVDLTWHLNAVVCGLGMRTGVLNVQSLHTTTAVVINEHEPLLLDDFKALLDQAAPADVAYRHDDATIRTVNVTPGERVNGHAHCRALLLGSAVAINVIDGKLALGRWQRVFFVELDGPRERDLSIVAMGERGLTAPRTPSWPRP